MRQSIDALIDQIADAFVERVQAKLSANSHNGRSEQRLITLKQAAKYLALSYSTIKKMVAVGEIRTVSKGSRRMIDVVDLDAWISANKR